MEDLYIGGKWDASGPGATSQTSNPLDASVLETVAEASPDDVERAITVAREALERGSWWRTSAAQRDQTLAEACADVDDAAEVFSYCAGIADAHVGRVVDPGKPNVASRIVHKPVGVCALITPWDYPLPQMSWKLAPALAAGNTVVVKPSDLTPLTTIALAALTEEACIPPGTVNLLLGSGDTMGQAMVSHPRVDLIFFTCGLTTGEKVMAAAARGVRRVALELGGKNPSIVFADADLTTAVGYAFAAAFLHSGQVCSAGSRLIVQPSIHDDFVTELAVRADRIGLGSGLDPATESGPLISAQHRAKGECHTSKGPWVRGRNCWRAAPGRPNRDWLRASSYARWCSPPAAEKWPSCGRRCSAPSWRWNDSSPKRMRSARQRHRLRPGRCCLDNRCRPAERVAAALRHGTVWINDFHPYLPQAEWGGFGKPGIGRELGSPGLEECQEEKHIYYNINPEPIRWFSG